MLLKIKNEQKNLKINFQIIIKMGINNLNNRHLTDEQVKTMNDALTSLEKAVEGVNINLTPEDRNRYGRVNEQNKLFINKVNDIAITQPNREKIDRYIQKIKDIKVKKDDKENKINALIQNDPKGTSGKISPIRVNGRMLPLLLLLLLLCAGGIWWFYPFSNSKKAVGNTIAKDDSVKPQVDTATTVELKENEIMPMSVFFDFNSATILGDGKELLDEYAKVYLQTNKKAKIVISGYTCDLGSDEINMSVANQRVLEVKKNLVAAGISEENIITHSYGKSKYGEFSYPDRKDYRRVILSIDK